MNAGPLYLVTDRSLACGVGWLDVLHAALRGGVDIVQLREKNVTTREFLEIARLAVPLCHRYGVPVIINDRLDIALASGADGLHVGHSDMPVEVAREILGSGRILGYSVESVADARFADTLPLDYIGVSPVFDTATKLDTAPALGLEGVREICRVCRHPAYGIGGISRLNARAVCAAGAHGIAVVSAVMAARDPEQSARELGALVRGEGADTAE